MNHDKQHHERDSDRIGSAARVAWVDRSNIEWTGSCTGHCADQLSELVEQSGRQKVSAAGE